MSKETYVILLGEATNGSPELGYWDGKIYRNGESSFVGVLEDQDNEKVKRYTNIKFAEKAANKLILEIDQVASAEIISINT